MLALNVLINKWLKPHRFLIGKIAATSRKYSETTI